MSEIKEINVKEKKNPKKSKRNIIATITSIVVVAIVLVMVFSLLSPNGVNYDVSGKVKIGNYKNLEVKKIEVSTTDEEVELAIAEDLTNNKVESKITEGTVKDGDALIIDYKGTLNGVAFEGGTAKDAELTIGSGSFIEGFESGLIDVEIGATKVLPLVFPEDYQEKTLAGQKVEFTVSVKGITRATVPLLDDAFAKKIGKHKSVAEYRIAKKAEVLKSKEKEALNAEETRIFEIIYKDSKVIEYPKAQLKRVIKATEAQIKNDADVAGLSKDDFIKQNMNLDAAGYEKTLDEYAKSTVKREMVIYGIAQKEKIELSSKDYKKYVAEQLKEMGLTEKAFKEKNKVGFEEYFGEENIYLQLYIDKVLDKVLEYSKEVS